MVIRGARQVGKSTLVRLFAEKNKLILNEINLEQHLGLNNIFKTLDARLISKELEGLLGRKIISPGFADMCGMIPVISIFAREM